MPCNFSYEINRLNYVLIHVETDNIKDRMDYGASCLCFFVYFFFWFLTDLLFLKPESR